MNSERSDRRTVHCEELFCSDSADQLFVDEGNIGHAKEQIKREQREEYEIIERDVGA